MRDFSFAINRSAHMMGPGEKNQQTDASVEYQVNNPLRRRLEDAVEDVFHAALQRGDLASAGDLLGVMESMHARGRVRFQVERKGSPLMIARARNELVSRKARRYTGAD